MREVNAIPVTPDVAPTTKKRPRRSVKAKTDLLENPPEPAVGLPSSPEPAPAVSPAPPAEKKVYDWDRTPQEEEQRQRDLVTSRTPFPIPASRTLAFPAFCEYWNDLIKQPVAKYARLYVHRWFPVLVPEEFENDHGLKREAYPNEKQFTAELGPLSENRLLTEVGVGDYTFRLNDSRRTFNDRTVVFCEKFTTMRNWDLYPPVFKADRLDWTDESNKVYIKWAQSRGRLPLEGEHAKEQANMASDQVVTQLLEQNKTLTDKVISAKADPPAAVKSENGGDGGAVKAALEFAAKAFDRPAAAPAGVTDPMTLVTGMVNLVQAITPPPDKTAAQLAEKVVAQAEAANTRIYELQKQGMQDLRAELDRLRAAPPITAPAPLTRRQMLEDLAAEQTLLGQVGGGKSRRPLDDEEERPSNIDKWLDVLPLITPVANGFVQGLFGLIQFGLQAWQTNHYNDAIGRQNGGQPKPPPMTESKPPEPGQPMQPQGPQPTPQQQAQQQQFQAILLGVAKVIGPLQRALQNSKTGAEFAAMIIEFTEEGRADYDRIRNVAESLTRLGMQVNGQPGIEQFKNAVGYLINMANPTFYQKIATVPTFGAFLEEFYEFDRIMAQEEAMRQSQGAQP